MEVGEQYSAFAVDGEFRQSSGKIVPWWSFTKTLIASLCLRLQEAGALDLNEPLPNADYSLRQLLNHSAGVPSYTGLLDYHEAVARRDDPWPYQEVLRRSGATNGSRHEGPWCYSNTGYAIARDALERATHTSLAELASNYLFQPLGLSSVRIAQKPEDLRNCRWLSDAGYHPGWVYHGLAIGTPDDAARFLDWLTAGNSISLSSWSELTTAITVGGPVPGRPWRTAAYGLGVMCGEMEGVGSVIGHSGNGGFSVCAIYSAMRDGRRLTAACFSGHDDEAIPEWAVQRLLTLS